MYEQYERLDEQMARFTSKLTAEVELSSEEAQSVATTVANEIQDPRFRSAVLETSPVPLAARIDELRAFQRWMDLTINSHDAAVARARIIVQNYVCFVYLPESLFKALLSGSQRGSVIRRCTSFLTSNPVRAFRNAMAHANWAYSPDFAGIDFWAKKGSDSDEPMTKFSVSQQDLEFWQALSRVVAYVVVTRFDAPSRVTADR